MLGAMLGCLGLAGADAIWRPARPAPAAAASAPGAGSAQVLTAPAGQPVGPLLDRLRAAPTPAALRLESLRNVFALSDGMRSALAAMAPKPAAEASGSAGPGAPASAPVLPTVRAILAGDPPLALLDDRLVSVGARLEQYRVVRIERDRVVLSDAGREVIVPLSVPWVAP
jgi:hypothetical protein